MTVERRPLCHVLPRVSARAGGRPAHRIRCRPSSARPSAEIAVIGQCDLQTIRQGNARTETKNILRPRDVRNAAPSVVEALTVMEGMRPDRARLVEQSHLQGSVDDRIGELAYGHRIGRAEVEALAERGALGGGVGEGEDHASDHILHVAKASALRAVAAQFERLSLQDTIDEVGDDSLGRREIHRRVEHANDHAACNAIDDQTLPAL